MAMDVERFEAVNFAGQQQLQLRPAPEIRGRLRAPPVASSVFVEGVILVH